MAIESARVRVSASRPLRLVVAGNSVGYFVRPSGTTLDDGPYAEQVVRFLDDAGVPVALTNRSRWFDQIDAAFQRIEPDVVAYVPDVVVLNFGWVECQPKLFPTAVLVYLTTYRPNLDPRTFRLRRAAVRRGARLYKKLTPWAATRWKLPSRMSPKHFEIELERYIRVVRRELRSLVVVLNVNPPTQRIEDVLPGVTARSQIFSTIIERVVSSFDDDQVQLLDTRTLVLDKGSDAVLPDGIHFNVEGHRLVAAQLADLVGSWLG